MDWQLLDYAKDAEDTAAGLHTFKGEVPEYSKDITGHMAELFAISTALHALDESLKPNRFGKWYHRIKKDLEIVLPSLGYTLDTINDMFGKSRQQSRQHPGAFPGTPPYNLIWEDTLADLKAEGIALHVRLENYRSYLQDMNDILKGSDGDEEVDRARRSIGRLLKKQEPIIREPIESYFSRLHVGNARAHGSRTPRPKSPALRRPKITSFSTYPSNFTHAAQAPPIPPPPPIPPRPGHPMYGDIPFMPAESHWVADNHWVPPAAPDAPSPQSPTYSTASSQTFSIHSNDSNSGAYWATKIFDGRHSTTPFRTLDPKQATKCFGRDEPQAIELLEEYGFEKVLELPFEATDVWVRLYWRRDDNRAKILFLTLDPSGRRLRHCIALTALKVLRTESCLQLCRGNYQDGRLDLWANLRFTLYERMVLFYCTVVAMKRQDQKPTPPELDDWFSPGEKEEFGGEIKDNSGSLHAFRIFRDKDSGGVRFEATARRGSMNTVPIWTAFVTQYIGKRNWMKRVGSKTVQFRELHPYVFHQGYGLPRGQSGRYQLTFTSPEDARDLMEVFHRIKRRT